MAKKKSKSFLEDGSQRLVLAAVAGGKILGEAFTKCFDTYKEKHEASEKKEEGGWLEDFLKNSAKSMEEMLRHLSKLPKEMVDTYLEEEDEEEEEKKQQVTKQEPQIQDQKKDKTEKDKEKDKEESGEVMKPPANAQGKPPAKTVPAKKSRS
jgi:hypothetical protein